MTLARLRPLAEDDLVQRTRLYRAEAGRDVAERFFDAAVDTLRTIEDMPGVGPLRLGEMCGIPGLRSFRVAGFPCGWFHLDRSDHLDVVRLLHFAQDVPGLLAASDEG